MRTESSPLLAPPPEPFSLESQPTSYVRSFELRGYQCWVWREGDGFVWNVETLAGSERARGGRATAQLAESDARKAAFDLPLAPEVES